MRTYETYQKNLLVWKTMLTAYMGGQEYINDNLIKHPREKETVFKARRNRAYYLNYCRQFVNLVVNFIFSSPGHITMELGDVEYLRKSADNKGTALLEFSKSLLQKSLMYGQMGLLIDSPAAEINPVSKQQQIEIGLNYYLVQITPDRVEDYSQDLKTGAIKWVSIREEQMIKPNPFIQPKKEVYYKVFYPGKIDIYTESDYKNSQNKPFTTIPTNFETVPFSWIMPLDVNRDGIGESLLADIHPINKNIFNLCSLIDEQVYSILFPIWLIPEDSLEESPVDPVSGKTKELELGVNEPIITTANYKKKIELLTPSSDPIKTIMELIEMLRLEIIRILGLNTPGNLEMSNPESGLAKIIDFIDTNNTLSTIALMFATQLTKTFQQISKAMGKPDGSINFALPSDFNVTSITKIIDDILRVSDLVDSKLFNEKIQKLLAKKILNAFETPEEIDKVTDEITRNIARITT